MSLFDGVRVLDLSRMLAGPYGSMLLADMGAEVIKVEEPGRGDYTRSIGASRLDGVSFLHLRWNRGKQSVAVDLRSADGAAVFRDLVAKSEVVIEGLRAGALARRGLGYDDLRAVNPALVFCSLSGFGRTGPYATAKGYEALVMARIGALSASGNMVTRSGPAHVSVKAKTNEGMGWIGRGEGVAVFAVATLRGERVS